MDNLSKELDTELNIAPDQSSDENTNESNESDDLEQDFAIEDVEIEHISHEKTSDENIYDESTCDEELSFEQKIAQQAENTDVIAEQKGFMKVISTFIPLKGDKPTIIVRKAIFLVSLILMIVSISLLIAQAMSDEEEIEVKDELIGLRGNISITESDYQEVKDKVPGILDEYVELYKENKDIIGWIEIEGTAVNYPIMQQKDTNKYYLSHNFYKEESRSGCIVADYRNTITATYRPANTILYGHNMASGAFFASILNYKPYYDRLDYYSEHPVINMDTIYEKGKYKIFAAMLVNVDKEDGDVFYYCLSRTFKNKGQFNTYIGNILDRSAFFNPDVPVTYGDEIITLSTCDFSMGMNKNLRWVVFARRVRDGESAEVDVSKAYVNENPLYFEYYYNVMGGAWNGRQWDTSLLTSYNNEPPSLETTARNTEPNPT